LLAAASPCYFDPVTMAAHKADEICTHRLGSHPNTFVRVNIAGNGLNESVSFAWIDQSIHLIVSGKAGSGGQRKFDGSNSKSDFSRRRMHADYSHVVPTISRF
jgi:hypothetical protein